MVLEMTSVDDDSSKKTSFLGEKSWLAAIVVALGVQVFSGIWWASSTSTQLNSIEVRLSSVEKQLNLGISDQITKAASTTRSEDKISRLEERDLELLSSVKDISAHIAVVESFLNTQSRNVNNKK